MGVAFFSTYVLFFHQLCYLLCIYTRVEFNDLVKIQLCTVVKFEESGPNT